MEKTKKMIATVTKPFQLQKMFLSKLYEGSYYYKTPVEVMDGYNGAFVRVIELLMLFLSSIWVDGPGLRHPCSLAYHKPKDHSTPLVNDENKLVT